MWSPAIVSAVQNAPETSTPTATAKPGERKIVFLFCCLAAIHTVIFSAAFPFFNNVDEQFHFDLVTRYAHGEIPRTMDPPSAEAIPYLAMFGSLEYFWSPEAFPDGKIPPPPWTLEMDALRHRVLPMERAWQQTPNYEAAQPPLYYSVAGAWWRSAGAAGLHDGFLLYWLRFLNAGFVALLVWLGYVAARLVFPEREFLRLGVPALLAFLPQTAFYSIDNDILSPLCFGAAFISLIKFWRTETPTVPLGIGTGLALAATYLTKISNLPLLVISAALMAFRLIQQARNGKWRASWRSWFALALCALLPVALWMAWTRHNFGDYTGTARKISVPTLGWTYEPMMAWWHHPIFTPNGFWIFISKLLASFWRGEFVWHRVPLASPLVDLGYVISSIALVGMTWISLLRKPANTSREQRHALWFALACFASVIAFMGFLSIIYDFHDCPYPSRAQPYFVSGRLLLGALIPFLLLFLYGLDQALAPIRNKWLRPLLLTGLVLFMLIGEITVDRPVFSSPYNWFHL